jgi:hypothetical protein
MKKIIVAMTVGIALIAWSCSKVDTANGGLRQSVEKGVADISHAVSTISGTPGYQLLTVSDNVAKSDFAFNDTINMKMVAGVYDFQPDTVMRFHDFSPYRLFKKTGDNENMVVNLPEMLVMHPRHLLFFDMKDTVYPNNFTITATDYHLYFNWWHNYEYKLTAGLSLNNANAGSMDVSSTSTSEHSNAYSSSYTFKEGYHIATVWQDGDTATSSFYLTQSSDTLFKETSTFIWSYNHEGMDKMHHGHDAERLYDLTIGNVEVKKAAGIDSIQVFVGGVLQGHAAQIVTDQSDTTASVCHKRDVILTYDDGTTAKLSELMAPIKEQLKTLRESLRSMYFSKHIVDYIAYSIYFESHPYNY